MNTDRFRFRLWDKVNEFYQEQDADDCYISHDGKLLCVFWGDYDTMSTQYVNQEDAIIEQCTGLKDKNGKLIFEGDVVKTVTGAIGIVQWIPARCGFLIYFPDNAICLVHETQEIIGNIHDEQFREVTKKVENERD
jgi:uncharacterized phage protein (TIGR01671 family)